MHQWPTQRRRPGQQCRYFSTDQRPQPAPQQDRALPLRGAGMHKAVQRRVQRRPGAGSTFQRQAGQSAQAGQIKPASACGFASQACAGRAGRPRLRSRSGRNRHWPGGVDIKGHGEVSPAAAGAGLEPCSSVRRKADLSVRPGRTRNDCGQAGQACVRASAAGGAAQPIGPQPASSPLRASRQPLQCMGIAARASIGMTASDSGV